MNSSPALFCCTFACLLYVAVMSIAAYFERSNFKVVRFLYDNSQLNVKDVLLVRAHSHGHKKHNFKINISLNAALL